TDWVFMNLKRLRWRYGTAASCTPRTSLPAANVSTSLLKQDVDRTTRIVSLMLVALVVALLLASCGTSTCPPGVQNCEITVPPSGDESPTDGPADPTEDPSGPTDEPGQPDEEPGGPGTPGDEPEDPEGPSDLPGEPLPPSGLVRIYASPTAGGSRDGSEASPMSLRSALLQAVRNRVDGIGTHIVLLPGTYRSTLIPEWTGDGPAPIVIEAAQSGTSIISGADVWSDWDCSGSICTRSWPYNWGVAPNPWAGDVDIGPLARR